MLDLGFRSVIVVLPLVSLQKGGNLLTSYFSFFSPTESYVNSKNYMALDTVNFVFC